VNGIFWGGVDGKDGVVGEVAFPSSESVMESFVQ